MNSKPIARAFRQSFPGRNPLATAGDRLEGAVLVLCAVVALLAVPVAGVAGSELYARQSARVVREREERRQVEAVLLENAPPVVQVDDRGTVLETTPVRARWTGPDGQAHEDTVEAHHGALVGTALPIWVDRRGHVTEPPLPAATAVANAAGAALMVWIGVAGASALLWLATRFAHTRSRLRRWELEWQQVSRDWTAR
ncbi:hypothetical protein [Lentzea sp.]|uniref:Rv1733c family protein n=1 Tax=Lentzea sp. TaxID=56099 RepID=UPI002ED5C17C